MYHNLKVDIYKIHTKFQNKIRDIVDCAQQDVDNLKALEMCVSDMIQ